MTEFALMIREYKGHQVEQRPDGYLNATAMCKANGKEWSGYIRNAGSMAFLDELAETLQVCRESLIESHEGRTGGTYVHPQVAIHLAQWLSPAFAVKVTEWVLTLLQTGKVELQQAPEPRALVVSQDLADAIAALVDHRIACIHQPPAAPAKRVNAREYVERCLPDATNRDVRQIIRQAQQLYEDCYNEAVPLQSEYVKAPREFPENRLWPLVTAIADHVKRTRPRKPQAELKFVNQGPKSP